MTFSANYKDDKYYGIDGDKVGGLIDAFFIKNDVQAMEDFSKKVSLAMDEIQKEVKRSNGNVIFCAGDSILFRGNFENSWCENLLSIFLKITGRTASMGVGNNVTETYLGLKLAKASGGGRMMNYSFQK